jgi:hypothetical protein
MSEDGRVPTIELETVLDWIYCEAKVWWQTVGRNIEEEAERLIRPRTGKTLFKEAVQGMLTLGVEQARKGSAFELNTLLGTLWKVRLKKWGLTHIRKKMAAYAVTFEEIMERFMKEGEIRKPDGSLYENPTWSHRWRDLAISTGLSELRMEIDAEQHKAGLGKAPECSKLDLWKQPIGLADAFSRSYWTVQRNTFRLEQIEGVTEEVYVSLPHIRIGVTPDLILRPGDEKLIYEKHLYEMRNPRIPDLMADYGIKALFSAQQEGSEQKANSVYVRHLMTGKRIRLKPRRAAGLNEIASMAAAVHRRLNARDFSGPRMVNGWDACGSCEYKPLCFDGEGLMQRYNLPLSGRITVADELIENMQECLSAYSEEKKRAGMAFARVFLPWVAQNPGMTEEQIEWLLTGLT